MTTDPIADALDRLRRAGWSCGDVASRAEGGELTWLMAADGVVMVITWGAG
jgi:hypothetical protein